ncbi:hypothetical protein F5Y15DRAFT_398216 [Xylariaceae sp. FL0016]|nr:hypothetical protein F5Y15DRAFT_398216 [Xylariaceae sp. FL0016]
MSAGRLIIGLVDHGSSYFIHPATSIALPRVQLWLSVMSSTIIAADSYKPYPSVLFDMAGFRLAPGKRCPTCCANGTEVWVLPGRCCGYCGTYVG